MHANKYTAAVIPPVVHEFPDDCRAQAETCRKYYKQVKAGLTLFAQGQGMPLLFGAELFFFQFAICFCFVWM
jgi:hypothetical protein